MRHENGLLRQPGSSCGRGWGGLLAAAAICCPLAWAWPSTVCAQDVAAPELPAELRPLDIVRPTLAEDAAADVADLETRIEELEERGVTAETREAQDAALDEAISLAERVLAIRAERQTGWTDAGGDVSGCSSLLERVRPVRQRAVSHSLRPPAGNPILWCHEATRQVSRSSGRRAH